MNLPKQDMSLPKHYPSEIKKFNDPITGRLIWQLTQNARNGHFYFTENSFVDNDEEIYFTSDRDTPGCPNMFHMDLCTGEITRKTYFTGESKLNKPSKTPDGGFLLYNVDNKLVLHETKTDKQEVIYTVPEGWRPGRCTMNCDETLVAILQCEIPPARDSGEYATSYPCEDDFHYRYKRHRIDVIEVKTGKTYNVRYDTHLGGHLQFSPVDPNMMMFCHEGPWHLVKQRIWLLHAKTGEIRPVYRQGANDCVGHEFWTRNGRIFFDNRGPNHDGTISTDKTQMIIKEKVDTGLLPIVGLADANCKILRTIELQNYCNHYHATTDEELLVGDDVDDLLLIDISGEKPVTTVLTRHSTSWVNQGAHCHPTFGWKDKRIIYTTDCTGSPQIYMLEI